MNFQAKMLLVMLILWNDYDYPTHARFKMAACTDAAAYSSPFWCFLFVVMCAFLLCTYAFLFIASANNRKDLLTIGLQST